MNATAKQIKGKGLDMDKLCTQYQENQKVNPVTKRPIASSSTIHSYFRQNCIKYVFKAKAEAEALIPGLDQIENKLKNQGIHTKDLFKDLEVLRAELKQHRQEIETLRKEHSEINQSHHQFQSDIAKSHKDAKTELLKEIKKFKQEVQSIYVPQNCFREYIDYLHNLIKVSASETKSQISPRQVRKEKERSHIPVGIRLLRDYYHKSYHDWLIEKKPYSAFITRIQISKFPKQMKEQLQNDYVALRYSSRVMAKLQALNSHTLNMMVLANVLDESVEEDQPQPQNIQHLSALKTYYIDTLKSYYASNDLNDLNDLNANFDFNNFFHPNKLPVDLKEFLRADVLLTKYANTVFSTIKDKHTSGLTLEQLEKLLEAIRFGGKVYTRRYRRKI